MQCNKTEIAGKLAGSGLFVYGLTGFFSTLSDYQYKVSEHATLKITTAIVQKVYAGVQQNAQYPPMMGDYILPAIFMVLGLTLLFIKYPESK